MESKNQQQQQQPSSSEPLQVSVPKEIIVEILLRLPVESLLRCKRVCKLWYSLISDPHFIKSHLKSLSSISNNNNYMHHRIYFNSSELLFMGIRKTLKYFPVYDVLRDRSVNAFYSDYRSKDNPNTSVSILVTCNGLLCVLIDHDTLCIWNPGTRTSSKRFSPCYDYNMRFLWLVVYGFGYDESTDDYKLVELSFLFNSGPTKYDTLANIYSLRSGSWKKIDGFPYGLPSDHSGKFSNGCLHWVTDEKIGLSYRWTIVSFDLAKETYGELSQPVVYDEGDDQSLTLGVLGERLCVLCNYNANNCGYQADVWVMKVYGETDSWTKLMSISYPTHHGNKPMLTIPNLGNKPINMFSVPLCIFNDGKVLLHLGSKLFLYDSKNSSFSEIQYNFDKWHQSDIIVESLVSPDALPDIGKLRI